MEREEKEKVPVPVPRHKPTQENEPLEETSEEKDEANKVWEAPRRWRIY